MSKEVLRRGQVIQALVAGADATMATVSTVLAGAQIGDRVVSVMNITNAVAAANRSASFEGTITVLGQIQQTATDLTAETGLLVTLQRGA